MKPLFYIIGTVLIAVSIYLRYWRGKRRIERRNVAGLQTFKSYNQALKAIYFENFVQFIPCFAASPDLFRFCSPISVKSTLVGCSDTDLNGKPFFDHFGSNKVVAEF